MGFCNQAKQTFAATAAVATRFATAVGIFDDDADVDTAHGPHIRDKRAIRAQDEHLLQRGRNSGGYLNNAIVQFTGEGIDFLQKIDFGRKGRLGDWVFVGIECRVGAHRARRQGAAAIANRKTRGCNRPL